MRNLGQIGDKDTENEVLLLEHDVPHSTFSAAVMKCLPKLPWIITRQVSSLNSCALTTHKTYLLRL